MDNERGVTPERERGLTPEQLSGFWRNVRIEEDIVDADLADMHAKTAAYRAEQALKWAERHWEAAKRDALSAWRAHKADKADADLQARYAERWDVCKAAYRSVKLARRAVVPLREFAAAAESAHSRARAWRG